MKRFLSLGAGVQSSTLLLASCRGLLPKLDAAVFADTRWEPRAVYAHLDWLAAEAEKHGIPVRSVSKGDLRADALRSWMRAEDYKANGGRWASMPLYTRSPDGTVGMIHRQCTKEYKLQPLRREFRRLAGYGPRDRVPMGAVEVWIGISTDETQRMRQPDVRWTTNRYPLVYDLGWSRERCLAWLAAEAYPRPPRSACIGCPFHGDAEWRAIRANPEEWADAVAFDYAIRKTSGLRGETFLHRSCRPLAEVDLRTDEERGQGQLPFAQECTGMCGQ